MKRCHKCVAYISTGKEVYVKKMPYHTDCAPEPTAEIGVQNVVALDLRFRELEDRVEALEAHIRELKG